MHVIEHRYQTADALAASLASVLAHAADDALRARGRACFALAGGRTPLPAYRAFAAAMLDWPRIALLPGDDRCVPHAHPASNVRALREVFAQCGAVVEALTTADGEPDASLQAAQAMLARHADAFDIVVLGMGNDAHTASLFPGAPQLRDALDPASTRDACRIDPDPLPAEAPFPRISLTLPRLLRTRAIHLLVTGVDKRAVFDRACAADADPLRMPIAALLQHAPAVHVHWSP